MDEGRQTFVQKLTELGNSMGSAATQFSTIEGLAGLLRTTVEQDEKEKEAKEKEKRKGAAQSYGPGNKEYEGGAANGAILSGPKTGYRALLHGTEAVVPLPDGKTIPVALDTTKLDASLSAVMDSMAQTSTSQSDKLAGLMEQSVRLNGEILDALKAGNRNGMRMVKAMS